MGVVTWRRWCRDRFIGLEAAWWNGWQLIALPSKVGRSAGPPLQVPTIHIGAFLTLATVSNFVKGSELKDAAALVADSPDVEVDAPGLAVWRPPTARLQPKKYQLQSICAQPLS